MTRKQALNYLYCSGYSEEQVQAVVDALTCEDAISRKDALKCFEEFHQTETLAVGYIRSRIRQLSSVNPTHKHVEPTQKNDDNTLDALGDAVSREAVMGLVAREHTEWDDLYIDIAKLPPVNVRQTIQKPLKCRNANCGAMCSPADAEMWSNDPEKCPNYKRVERQTGEWIPVSEPPKELGTYLIQTDGEPYMCQCRWTDVNPFWTDYKTKPHWNIFDLPQYRIAVAWMPLPEPYKEEGTE